MNNIANSRQSHDQFSIVRPNAQDAVELATMHNQSWIDTYPEEEAGISLEYIKEIIAGRLTEKGLGQRRDNIERAKNDPNYFLRIARNESGDIVGFIDGFFENDKYELAGFYTDKATHGSGLAMQLWRSYERWTDPKKTIWLTVVTYNERAKAFYKKIGFSELPETKRLYSGTHIPVVDMIRAQED